MISINTTIVLYAGALIYLLSLAMIFFKKRNLFIIMLSIASVVNFIFLVLHGFSSGEFMFPHFLNAGYLLPLLISIIVIYKFLNEDEDSYPESGIIVSVFFYATALIESQTAGVLGPNKISIWSTLFHLTTIFGHACFYLGAWYAFIYLLKEEGKENFHILLIIGFIMHTAGQVTGAIWCFLGWAMTFQWVYVHMQSAAIWCFYACYVHLVYIQTWNIKSRAKFAIAGGILLIFFGFIAPAGNLIKLIAEV